MQIQINAELHDTLKTFSSKYATNAHTCVLWFIGYYHPSTPTIPTIISCVRGAATHTDNINISHDYLLISSIVPAGLHVVGLFLYTDEVMGTGSEANTLTAFLQQHQKDIISIFSNKSNNDNNKNDNDDNNVNRQIILATTKKSLQMTEFDEIYYFSVEYSNISGQQQQKLMITRVLQENVHFVSTMELHTRVKELFLPIRVNIHFNFSFAYPDGGYKQRLSEAVAPLLETIKNGIFIISVKSPAREDKPNHTDSTSIIITSAGEAKERKSVTSILEPLCKDKEVEWLDSTVFVSMSPSRKSPATLSHDQSNEGYRVSHISSHLSALYYLTTAVTTTESFLEKISDTLFSLSTNYIKLMSDGGPNICPTTLHFLPPKFPHLITVLYPIDKTIPAESEEYLVATRTAYHRHLLLPMDKPLLRISNKLTFIPTVPSIPNPAGNLLQNDYRLKNIHQLLQLDEGTSTGGGKYLVQGSYLYYHYQQDMNDSGWGCAYRSLQTICSWMVLQGYTAKPVPTHLEIQQILIDLKDKNSKFLGSNNWIGAQEVFLCLDHLYGVTSKILNVSSGLEISQKGRELSHHFRTEGTPIMIGGGVLAYTLLGIDYDEKSGNIKFLILDPHYIGPENLKTIKDKWCSWKGGDIFRKDAFYNLCMPLRPRKV